MKEALLRPFPDLKESDVMIVAVGVEDQLDLDKEEIHLVPKVQHLLLDGVADFGPVVPEGMQIQVVLAMKGVVIFWIKVISRSLGMKGVVEDPFG